MNERAVVGYAEPWSACAGERVRFHVGARRTPQAYRAEIVRLRRAAPEASGRGLVEEVVGSLVDGDYTARVQRFDRGSRVVVPADPGLAGLSRMTLQLRVCPTRPGGGRRQALMGTWDDRTRGGFALFLAEDGSAGLVLGDGRGAMRALCTGVPLRVGAWTLVEAVVDPEQGSLELVQRPIVAGPGAAVGAEPVRRRESIPCLDPASIARPIVFAAWRDGEDERGPVHAAHFDGRLAAPRLVRRLLDDSQRETLAGVEPPVALVGDVVGHWDFAALPEGRTVLDRSPAARHGRCENLPTRAVRGPRWDGREHDWRDAPEHYDAIHFHADDVYDPGWETAFELEIPAAWAPGVYAARLRSGDGLDDHVPFFVCPPRGESRSPVAFLAPTATYAAYANLPGPHAYSAKLAGEPVELDADHYAAAADFGGGCYHVHEDGSGLVHSSILRPMLTLRPHGDRWGLNADLEILDWLEREAAASGAEGTRPDLITDERLDEEGAALLSRYRVVVTGSHPEYHTTRMLDAFEAYLAQGGRLMYLGGNGFYWRIARSPAWPFAIELRRAEDGTRTWAAPPGEYHHAWGGELGGLWRRIGRAPNRLVGVGFAAQGFRAGRPYRIAPGARASRGGFVFEGLETDEIGRAGPLDGAAGEEIDRHDAGLGSPPHAIVLATASGFGPDVLKTKEEFLMSEPHDPADPDVRADLVFFETPRGGAVFSTGSIAWAGGLVPEAQARDDSVARVTRNVLRRFLDPTPFESPTPADEA